MTTKQQDKPNPEADKTDRQQLNAAIGQHALRTLGQPGDLYKVQVRRLWDDRYRVNFFVGLDASTAKIANSYFVVVDGAGNILASTPKLTKQY